MNRKRVIIALYALLAVGVVGGGTVSAAQADEPPNHANRLEATFTETNVSVTNRDRRPGCLPADQHRHRHRRRARERDADALGDAGPLSPSVRHGQLDERGRPAIVLADGVLVLRELVHICPTDSGPLGHGHVGGGRRLEHRDLRRRPRERRRHDRHSNEHGNALGQAEPRRLTISNGASPRTTPDSVRGEALSDAEGCPTSSPAPSPDAGVSRAAGRFSSGGSWSPAGSRS